MIYLMCVQIILGSVKVTERQPSGTKAAPSVNHMFFASCLFGVCYYV